MPKSNCNVFRTNSIHFITLKTVLEEPPSHDSNRFAYTFLSLHLHLTSCQILAKFRSEARDIGRYEKRKKKIRPCVKHNINRVGLKRRRETSVTRIVHQFCDYMAWSCSVYTQVMVIQNHLKTQELPIKRLLAQF